MRKVCFALIFLLLLCGCRMPGESTEVGSRVLSAYFISDRSMLTQQEVVVSSVSQEATIRTLFSELQEHPNKKGLRPAVPSRVMLDSYSLHSGTLTLVLSGEYDEVSGVSRTLSDAALTCSYCLLDSVDFIVIRTPSYESAPLSASDYIFTVSDPVEEPNV